MEVYKILKESMRNLQMGQRGARIQAPECPVISNLEGFVKNEYHPIFHLLFRCALKKWHLPSKYSTASMVTSYVAAASLTFRCYLPFRHHPRL